MQLLNSNEMAMVQGGVKNPANYVVDSTLSGGMIGGIIGLAATPGIVTCALVGAGLFGGISLARVIADKIDTYNATPNVAAPVLI